MFRIKSFANLWEVADPPKNWVKHELGFFPPKNSDYAEYFVCYYNKKPTFHQILNSLIEKINLKPERTGSGHIATPTISQISELQEEFKPKTRKHVDSFEDKVYKCRCAGKNLKKLAKTDLGLEILAELLRLVKIPSAREVEDLFTKHVDERVFDYMPLALLGIVKKHYRGQELSLRKKKSIMEKIGFSDVFMGDNKGARVKKNGKRCCVNIYSAVAPDFDYVMVW